MKVAEFPKLALNIVAYVYNQYVPCVLNIYQPRVLSLSAQWSEN